jgi:hypothetical protein
MTWLWSCPAGARPLEGEPMASDMSRSTGTSPPPTVDQDLALMRVETSRV